MKKLITTLTALAFVLGLTVSGFAQTTVKEGDKPAVQTQTPGATSQVTPVDKDKGKEATKPVAKEDDKAKGKDNKAEKQVSKKEKDKKPVTTASEPQKENNKEVTK